MSMHLRGSSDMMRNEEEGWWTSRTGLEQKLIILSTVLFIVAFSLTITVIVYKNRTCPECPTTVAPPTTATAATGETTPNTDTTVSSSPEVSSTASPEITSTSSPATTPTTAPTTLPTTPSKAEEKPTTTIDPVKPENNQAVPLEKSFPLMSMLKEANRLNDELEKMKLKGA